jgi:hypothetical protein
MERSETASASNVDINAGAQITSGRLNLGSVRWFVPTRPAEPDQTVLTFHRTKHVRFFFDPIFIMILRASLLYFRVGHPRVEQNRLFLKMQKMSISQC